jgi:hypothetical protein
MTQKMNTHVNNAGINLMRFGYQHIAKPIVFRMEPDKAHETMVSFCKKAEKNTRFNGFTSFHD